jgi:hypothetical protein
LQLISEETKHMGRRVFISYQHDDMQQAKGFNLLRWNPNVDFDFVGRHLLSPVQSKDPNYIRAKINEQLNGSSVVAVLIGQNTASSEWVDYEIRRAQEEGKGIIGIRLKGAEATAIPPALTQVGAKVINWNPDTFSDEIEGAALIAGRPELEPPSPRSAVPSSCVR